MPTETEERTEEQGQPQNSFMAKAQELEEEHGELKGWLLNLTQGAKAHNDSDEPLMQISDVDWPDGADTEKARQEFVQKQFDREQVVLGRAATMKLLAGTEDMVRDRDAFFESPEWTSFVGMKEAFAGQQNALKAQIAGFVDDQGDRLLDPLFDAVKEYGGGRYSKDAMLRFLKEQRGEVGQFTTSDGEEIKNLDGMTGFRLHTDDVERGGLKAMITQTPGSSGTGLEPLPMVMDRITRLAQRRPNFFSALPQMSMTERGYIWREETGATENVGYTAELASRADTVRESSITVRSFNKAMLRGTSYMAATYEQLEYEPMARNLFRQNLIGGIERWIDRETMTGGRASLADTAGQALGAAGLDGAAFDRVFSLKTLTPSASTAANAWSAVSTTGRGNYYNHGGTSADKTNLRTIRHALAYMEAEDFGMSMPTHLIMTPYAYEDLTSVVYSKGSDAANPTDARWLFPAVLMNGDTEIRPFGVPILKSQSPAWTDPQNGDTSGDKGDSDQTGLLHDQIYVIDVNHMVLRTSSAGITLEVDRHPRRGIEEIVAHFGFQFDVWRRLAVLQLDNMELSGVGTTSTPSDGES